MGSMYVISNMGHRIKVLLIRVGGKFFWLYSILVYAYACAHAHVCMDACVMLCMVQCSVYMLLVGLPKISFLTLDNVLNTVLRSMHIDFWDVL